MNPKKSLDSRSSQEISRLFKAMLTLVEDMKNDHDFHYQKLYDELPEQYHSILRTADHFTPTKLAWIRKRILDCGNESIRNIQKEIDNYSVSFVFKNKD